MNLAAALHDAVIPLAVFSSPDSPASHALPERHTMSTRFLRMRLPAVTRLPARGQR